MRDLTVSHEPLATATDASREPTYNPTRSGAGVGAPLTLFEGAQVYWRRHRANKKTPVRDGGQKT